MPRPEQITFLVGGILFAIIFGFMLFNPEIAPQTLSGNINSALEDNHDEDFDGLSNYEELEITLTNPYEADTDGDGAKDGFEVYIRESDPLSP